MSQDEDQYIDFSTVEGNTGWWEGDVAATKKGEQRWTTLSHNGVLFPPPYEPHGIPILYEGTEFVMTPAEEEVATMFAALRENDYYRQDTFRKNFFTSWLKILNKRGEHPIRRLEYVNFDAIWEWQLQQKQKKLEMTRDEKKKAKSELDKLAAPFKYCLWDGKKEEVANYRVEPPGLFRGRGEHPLRGTLKQRVVPEDVTINIDPTAPVPKCLSGHRWGGVVHDNTKTWLACWEDNVTGDRKYVMLAASSTIKGLSDREKFERARRLHQHIDKIRDWYRSQWNDVKSKQARQLGVATYFIDRLALRVGNEKSEDEADTVGCCSLRVEHVKVMDDNILHFDFLGKDSIRYENDVTVDPKVHALVKEFTAGKKPKHQLFDQVDPADLNENFKQFMPDLTAKVFRTYNASKCLQDCFRDDPLDPKTPLLEKLVYFTKANTRVAELCNHQKSVGKAHYKQMAQMAAKESSMNATVERLRVALHDLKTKGVAKVAKEFYEAQDKEQREWLEQYGTDEERKAFEDEVGERGAAKVRVKTEGSSKKTSKRSSSSKKSGKSSSKKASKKVRTIDDADDEDDVPLFSLVPGKKNGKTKKEETKEESHADEEEAEEGEEAEEEEEEEGEEQDDEKEQPKSKPNAKDGSSSSAKTSKKSPSKGKSTKSVSAKKAAPKTKASKNKKTASKAKTSKKATGAAKKKGGKGATSKKGGKKK
jgi:DNA topoisomerase-1